MGKKKTHKEYIEELKIKNPNVEVIGEYINSYTNIMHRCLIHNIYWMTEPRRVLRGCGCEQCRVDKFKKSNTKSQDEYIKELGFLNPNIEVIENYIDARTKILHRCKEHNIIWSALPTNMLKGCGCEQCLKEKIGKKNGGSHTEYIQKLQNVNSNIIALENYINSEIKILHQCKICGHIWSAKPGNILAGKGCPKCNESHGERFISNWLTNNNITFIPQYKFDDCKDKRPLPFDFFLPNYNICIEFNGRQHYEPIKYFGGEQQLQILQYHDNIKEKYCYKKNIKLLCIRYDENIEEKLSNFIY